MTDQSEELKKSAARRAVEEVRDDSIVGLGSGSTLEYFIRELADRVRRERLRVRGVPTSLQARWLARQFDLPILDPLDAHRIDLTVDGADEVDPAGNLIKGGGAAHVVEKILAAWADRYVIVVDETKLVSILGRRFPIPVEVLAPALRFVLRQLEALGARPSLRTGSGKVGPIVSDLGHLVVDAKFPSVANPVELNDRLNHIPGIVGHGLFVQFPFRLIVARSTPTAPTLQVADFPLPSDNHSAIIFPRDNGGDRTGEV